VENDLGDHDKIKTLQKKIICVLMNAPIFSLLPYFE